jgi:hypothetical protein
MSIQNDERTITILRIISQADLGGEHPIGMFASQDKICDEMGEKHTTKDIIRYLEDMRYIRSVNKQYEEKYGRELGYKAYQITEHGKTHLVKHQGASPSFSYHQNNFGDITSSNISIDSQYVSQIIEEQDDETKELLLKLLEVTEKKDKSAILKTLGYIGDKSLDLLIAIIAGGARL